jgi:dihydropteroate synthase
VGTDRKSASGRRPRVDLMDEVLGLPAVLRGIDRCLVMGVVNVTPDSFSDGGRWFERDEAIARGLAMVADGADLVDVGGESTRPGAARVDVEEERRRTIPVVEALARSGAVVSIDTMRAEIAAAALEAGAAIVNDVSGGLADPLMAPLVARAEVPYVAMHWRGHSDVMEQRTSYQDVVADVIAELDARMHALTGAGMDPRQILLDPGLGFAKKTGHNWELLARLEELRALGRPVVVGTSRKRFLGALLADSEGTPAAVENRDDATVATSALAAAAGVWCVRVHEVRGSADAVRVAAAWKQAAVEPASGPVR